MRNLFIARVLTILGLFFLLSTSIFAQTVNAVDDFVTLTARDAEKEFDISLNDTLTKFDLAYHTVLQEPKHSTAFHLDEIDGIFTYAAKSGFIGRDTFTYILCDDELCDTATVIINVVAYSIHMPVNDTISVAYLGTDSYSWIAHNDRNLAGNDWFDYTFSLVSFPKFGKAKMTVDGDFEYISLQDFGGYDTFRYRSCDPYGVCAEAKILVWLDARPPVAVDDSFDVAYNRTTTHDVATNDIDPDGYDNIDTKAYKIYKNSLGTIARFVGEEGYIQYTPAKNFIGKDTVWYIATDGNYFDTARAFINVLPPALVWADDVDIAYDLAIKQSEKYFLDDYITYDEDFDQVIFKMYKPAKFGKINFVDGYEVSYSTTNTNFIGRDTASYIACTQNGVCDTALIFVNITNSNTTPFADDDYFYTKGEQINEDITFNDFDDEYNIVSSTLMTVPLFGVATLGNNGSFTYSPKSDVIGTDTLTYRVCDAFGLCDTAMIFIEVDTKIVTPTQFEIISNRTEVCMGGKVSLSIFINENNITQGLWEESLDGIKFIRISTTETPTYSPNTLKAGVKYIRCITAARDTSNVLSFAINPDPVVISNPQNANLTYFVGTSDADSNAVFKVVTSVDPNTLNYQWQSSDDNIIWIDMVDNSVNEGVETAVLTLIKPRINADKYYRVRMLPNQQGCNGLTSATATLTIITKPVPVGTRPITTTITEKVFPNPTNGAVEVFLKTSAGADITISNLVGQVLKFERINGQYARLDLSSYINGTYLLTIKTAIGFETMKIVKY